MSRTHVKVGSTTVPQTGGAPIPQEVRRVPLTITRAEGKKIEKIVFFQVSYIVRINKTRTVFYRYIKHPAIVHSFKRRLHKLENIVGVAIQSHGWTCEQATFTSARQKWIKVGRWVKRQVNLNFIRLQHKALVDSKDYG
jgi:hypothetical protein